MPQVFVNAPDALCYTTSVWIIPILANLVGNTGYNTILRYAASDKKIDPLFLAAIMSTAIAAPAVFGVFIARIDWSVFDTHIIIVYAITIGFILLLHIVNAKALENTEASIFSFLYNFRIGFATLLGIVFLGESLSPMNIAGGALVFVAGFFLMTKSAVSPLGVMFSIFTAGAISVLNTFEKYLIVEIGYTAYMFPSAIITACLLWIIVIGGKRPISKSFLASKEFVALSIFRSISAYGFTLALGLGALVSITTYISSFACVSIAIIGIIFLKETDALPKKILAGIIAVIGITFIFLST